MATAGRGQPGQRGASHLGPGRARVDKTSSLIREKPATVIRLAIRAGLPVVANRFQSPRPEGYFADDYPLSKDRLALEAAMSN